MVNNIQLTNSRNGTFQAEASLFFILTRNVIENSEKGVKFQEVETVIFRGT